MRIWEQIVHVGGELSADKYERLPSVARDQESITEDPSNNRVPR